MESGCQVCTVSILTFWVISWVPKYFNVRVTGTPGYPASNSLYSREWPWTFASTSQVLELEAWATNSANRLTQIWGCFPPPRPSLTQTSQCYFVNSLTVSVFLQMWVSSCGKWILRTPVNKHLFPRMMVLEFSSGLNSQYDLLAGRLPTLQLSGPARPPHSKDLHVLSEG